MTGADCPQLDAAKDWSRPRPYEKAPNNGGFVTRGRASEAATVMSPQYLPAVVRAAGGAAALAGSFSTDEIEYLANRRIVFQLEYLGIVL